jgi:hypothetical protein
MKESFLFYAFLATAFGATIAWIDVQPNWNDTGITALMIFISSLFCGYRANQKPWIIALIIGLWAPIFSMLTTQNFGAFLSLIPAFIGAYIGYLFRKIINP